LPLRPSDENLLFRGIMQPEKDTLDVRRSTNTGDLSKVSGRVDLCHGASASNGRQNAPHDVLVPTMQSNLDLQPFSGNGRCICERCAETSAARYRAGRRLALGLHPASLAVFKRPGPKKWRPIIGATSSRNECRVLVSRYANAQLGMSAKGHFRPGRGQQEVSPCRLYPRKRK